MSAVVMFVFRDIKNTVAKIDADCLLTAKLEVAD